MMILESRNTLLTKAESKPLRFHWRLPYAGESSGIARADQLTAAKIGLPDPNMQTYFCQKAEEAGIDSLLLDFGFAKPDPMLLAARLGQETQKIKFIIAYRSGLFAPTMFVQQVNTLSALINGRLLLNIVAGYSPEEQRAYGDFLSHDERYERTDEFLAICRSFWSQNSDVNFKGKYYNIEKGMLKTPFVSDERACPEIMIGGGSEQARNLAMRQGTCWVQLAEAPEKMKAAISATSQQGIEVGLRLWVIARPTREEAMRAAHAIVEDEDISARRQQSEKDFMAKTDSVSFKAAYEREGAEWLTPNLWTGAVHVHGPTAISLVGSAEEVAESFMEYKAMGVSQFILAGWPKLDEMVYFGQSVLPLIRKKEYELASSAVLAGKA
jgi:alkanesulfonate monooxygenase